jgi:hypothetical protein
VTRLHRRPGLSNSGNFLAKWTRFESLLYARVELCDGAWWPQPAMNGGKLCRFGRSDKSGLGVDLRPGGRVLSPPSFVGEFVG